MKGRGAAPMGISWKEPEYVCLQCGGAIADELTRFGSVLCHDCRYNEGVDAILTRKDPKHPSTSLWRGRRRARQPKS
jgi:hypothetical protein